MSSAAEHRFEGKIIAPATTSCRESSPSAPPSSLTFDLQEISEAFLNTLWTFSGLYADQQLVVLTTKHVRTVHVLLALAIHEGPYLKHDQWTVMIKCISRVAHLLDVAEGRRVNDEEVEDFKMELKTKKKTKTTNRLTNVIFLFHYNERKKTLSIRFDGNENLVVLQ